MNNVRKQSLSFSFNSFSAPAALSVLSIIWAALYLPSLNFEFVYDDLWMIVQNASLDNILQLHRFFLDPKTAAAAGTGISADVYRPLATLSFALNKAIFGSEAYSFRIFNLLLHAINTGLLFGLLRRRFSIGASLLGSTLFLLHPVQVESTVWIAQRSILLCGTGALLTLAFWDRQNENPRAIWISAAFFLFALLGKEAVVFLPLYFLWQASQNKKIKYQPAFLFLGISLAFAISRALLIGTWGQSTTGKFPIGESLIEGIAGLALMIKNIVWPLDLNVSYPWPKDPGLAFAIGCGILLFFSGVAFLYRKRNKAPADICMLALVFWLPYCGIFQLVTFTADRFLYLPLIAAAFLTAILGEKKALRPALISFLLILFCMSGLRLQDWKSEENLWKSSILTNSTNPFPHAALGQVYLVKGENENALFHFRSALSLNPTVNLAKKVMKNLILLYQDQENIQESEKWQLQLEKIESTTLGNPGPAL